MDCEPPLNDKHSQSARNDALPYFGIFHLNINEAAKLIARDMLISGYIPGYKEPEYYFDEEDDPMVMSLISGHTEKFKERLIMAINTKQLKADTIIRDFDEQLISKKTYIDYFNLVTWLNDRDYECGDTFTEWIMTQETVSCLASEEIAYLQASFNNGKTSLPKPLLTTSIFGDIEESDTHAMAIAYKMAVVENNILREQLRDSQQIPSKVDRPLTTNNRRTLLTIIAILCSKLKIDPQARGASQRIKELSELFKTPIDDGTIANILKEIPDALETRMK